VAVATSGEAFERLSENIYRFTDTCNVYVVRSGDACLLIDVGEGGVLDRLSAFGIKRVEWVLHTHHHRDQCQGDRRLDGGTRIAVPRRERDYFASAETFWNTLELDDRYLCANVFQTLAESVPVEHAIADHETFTWSGIDFLALPTPGHTRGSVTYLATIDGIRYAFCGDLIHSAGRLWTLHDLDWDYSVADGVSVLLHSAQVLTQYAPDRLAPSHGDISDAAGNALDELGVNLERLYAVVGRGYLGDINPPIASEPRLEAISEHLTGVTHTSANFYALTSDSGRALLFDYGFPSFHHVSGAQARFAEHSLQTLAEQRGIDRIDTVIPTHYHDDHVAGFGHLRRTYNTEVWAPALFANILERPTAYRLPAIWGDPVAIDQMIDVDSELAWEEYRFITRHVPGHTWYAVAYLGEIDGRRIAVSGDQIQRAADGKLRGGGPVYPNRMYSGDFARGISAILEFEPELLLTGHDGPIEVRRRDLDHLHKWCRDLEDTWQALAAFPDELDFALDPRFVRIQPYRSYIDVAQPSELEIIVDNHHDHEAALSIQARPPAGWSASPAAFEQDIGPGDTATFSLHVTAPPSAAPKHTFVLTLDVRLGEHHFGEVTEALLITDRAHTDEVRSGQNAS
jgi:glyoxylase-like metal-dependent hydrolase (beta-lactamase superfamily II)